MSTAMKCAIALTLGTVLSLTAFGESVIVKEGRPCAEIVISDQPPRMVKLAAEELQTYVEKMSGAVLRVTSTPSEDVPVQIYVGKSPYIERLNVTDDGLKHGAFRMVSGPDWLALVGDDRDFIPPKPYALNGGKAERERVMKEWDALTGAKWGNPMGKSLYRGHSKRMGIWHGDRHGSMNAVHEFLRGLGVRWYMAGELGEIVPKTKTIALPRVDRVVRPDFEMRQMYFATYFSTPREDIMWYLRLGLNHGGEVRRHFFTHGTRDVTSREEMKRAHPEYYALYGNKRDTKRNRQCLSSEGLLQENVRFVRAMFDIYDLPMVSVMPQDGYRICQCDLCKDKIDINRDRLGQISDYVWGYVNRVAKEVYKTHPGKKIACSAYADYTLPPTNIDKLSPNVVVGITHGRGKHFRDPATRKRLEELWRVWLDKSSNNLVINEHYVFTHRGTFLPVYFPHAIAEGLRALKGKSLGETVEVGIGPFQVRGHGLHRPGFNHLNVYVTARMYWDANQDVDALLDEYYRLFYGPAADEMKAFIEYSEDNWPDMRADVERIEKVLELLAAAQKKATPNSPYGKRIALVADYLKPLHHLREQLKKGRNNAPVARALWRRGAEGEIKVDGRLDEKVWDGLPQYALREDKTGRVSQIKTTFRMFWSGGRIRGSLCVGIRCEDPDMKNLNIMASKDGDTRIWDGDNVEIILETQSHSHYQLTISPAGALVDLDRKGGQLGFGWSSQADVAAHVGEDYWSVEARIPATGGDTAEDPLNGVVGRRPTSTYPWHFNVCRQRVRENGKEFSAFSPTGKSTFHDVMKFGKLYVR